MQGPNELLLKLNVTGLCYSDIHYMLEDLPLPRMSQFGVCSPGHEGAGIVVAMGSNVTGWEIGDRAGVAPTWDTCMTCELCANDMECHCPEAIPTGLKVPGQFISLKASTIYVRQIYGCYTYVMYYRHVSTVYPKSCTIHFANPGRCERFPRWPYNV